MAKKLRYYKILWWEGIKTSKFEPLKYSFIKNNFLFHDMNEFVKFTNINDEEDEIDI